MNCFFRQALNQELMTAIGFSMGGENRVKERFFDRKFKVSFTTGPILLQCFFVFPPPGVVDCPLQWDLPRILEYTTEGVTENDGPPHQKNGLLQMITSEYPSTVVLPKIEKPYPSILAFLTARFPGVDAEVWADRIRSGKVTTTQG